MRKLIIILLFAGIFAAADLIIAHIMEPDARTPREAVQRAATDLLAQILVHEMKLRMNLPQKVDDTTQLVDIRAERNMVTYRMTTTADGREFDSMMAEIHTHLGETACTREDYHKMLSYGLAIAIGYRSPSGQESIPVMITPQMCGAK